MDSLPDEEDRDYVEEIKQNFGEAAEQTEELKMLKTLNFEMMCSMVLKHEELEGDTMQESVISDTEVEAEELDLPISPDRELKIHVPSSISSHSSNKGIVRLKPMRDFSHLEVYSDVQTQEDIPQTAGNMPITHQKTIFEQEIQMVAPNNKLKDAAQMIIKEGWLFKKSNGLIGSFEKRYFTLSSTKLYQYNTEKRQKVRGVINFRVARCKVIVGKEKHFMIEIEQHKHPYILRSNSVYDCQEWIDQINYIVCLNHYRQSAWIKTVNLDTYLQKDSLTEEEFIDTAETGDILLFKTDNLAAKLQRGISGSDYDHVGMVVRFDGQQPRVFDSTGDCGVGLQCWYPYMASNSLYNQVSVRKLNFDRKFQIQSKIYNFVSQTLGKKYLLTLGKLLKRESVTRKNTSIPQEEGYFCSELVAKALKVCGLLDQKKSCTQYWPVDFSQERQLQLLQGAKLSDEMTIILKKHRYC